MKKTIAFLLVAFISHALKGQVLISLVFGDKLNTGNIEFGLDGGYSSSTIGGAPGAKYKGGFNLGFYFDIKTKNPSWMVTTGVVVKGPMGAQGFPVYSLKDAVLDSAFEGGTVTTHLNYFYVPITMKYTFKSHLFFKAGIQLGLGYKANDQFINSVKSEEDLTYELETSKDYHPIDAGLIAGIGYRLMKGHGMNIGFSYYYGMIDIRVDDALPNQYNRVFYLNVGIPIGKGKAEKKAQTKS